MMHKWKGRMNKGLHYDVEMQTVEAKGGNDVQIKRADDTRALSFPN